MAPATGIDVPQLTLCYNPDNPDNDWRNPDGHNLTNTGETTLQMSFSICSIYTSTIQHCKAITERFSFSEFVRRARQFSALAFASKDHGREETTLTMIPEKDVKLTRLHGPCVSFVPHKKVNKEKKHAAFHVVCHEARRPISAKGVRITNPPTGFNLLNL